MTFDLKFKKVNLTGRARIFFAREFFKNPLIQWMLILNFFINLANWLASFYFIRPADFPLILHYNVFFGVDLIGIWWQAYLAPFAGSLILIVNGVLAYVFFGQKERIASHLFLLGAFVVQLGTVIASASVIFINYF